MGFSDKNQILIEIFLHFKKLCSKNLLKNLRIKVGTVGTEQTFEKAARNWHDGKTALKAYRTFLVFLFCNIHTQTGYY